MANLNSSWTDDDGSGTVGTIINNSQLQTIYQNLGHADIHVAGGRLTLTSGSPVTTGDVQNATTLYYTPYASDVITLYDGVGTWTPVSFSETSIGVPASASQMYDVFIYNNGGTATMEQLAWTNDTTRATALTYQNGVYVKSGATTRRYVGSFRTTVSSGQTEDSMLNRFVWNYYNRVEAPMQVFESTASWTYATTTVRPARGQTTNSVSFIVGVAEDPATFDLSVYFSETGGFNGLVGIGIDSTTVIDTSCLGGYGNLATDISQLVSKLRKFVAIGKHTATWLEYSAGATVTFYSGSFPLTNSPQSGLLGSSRR